MNNKKINFFDLSRQWSENKNNLTEKINSVLDSQSYIGGKFIETFETNFSKYLNAKHAISCNSGTDALLMALDVIGMKKNEIVLTTPFSFIASSSEILALEGHAVFIDIDDKTYNIDTNKIEIWINNECEFKNNNLIHKNTGYRVAGILPVDIFGQCADYKNLRKIAKKYNLWIIQDSCQAVGSLDEDGIMAGNHGDITCFSFYPTKNLGAFGDGGACTTNDSVLAEKLLRYRNHGRKNHYNYIEHGINSRLDGIQAAILDEKLKLLENLNNRRREIAAIYNKEFSNLNSIELPKEIFGKHVYHQYCIKLNNINREELMSRLSSMGVGTNIYYPKGLNQIDFLNKEPRLKTECPISDNLTQTILALPIWPELTNEEVLYICEKFKEVINSNIMSKISSEKSINL
ncbi:DegT/DnrJ/EryC1/StrS family aminotransferase [Candidatus Dependentiae bacterium]|nr:DegT/DnrJ/EryC1/StrS family aminotransferase [Candidatus Dependentiae bacterium]MBU4387225.1 DegT/DnrJ/EryC1/StrS family aminotransferase [Candidatus Dependentiae bacterium]MCG2755954.1 DegT/DnrJ/EryC1/StrS family aminotransferase [Candidatus Dependentiae bacterium]